jgi:bzd-type benzoyl-CoA reductase N subunit
MKQSEECLQIIKDPNDYARKLKREKKIVGTLCSYTPEEIIVAAGAHPFRLFGSGEKVRFADAHLQSYCCSLARGVLEDALAGRLEFLDGVVFTHTCDTMQRLSDIWRINISGPFHLDVILPVKLDTQSARRYFKNVLQTFREELGAKLGVTISDNDLLNAIRTGNRIRKAFVRIYERINDYPGIIKGEELYLLDRAAMMMDKPRLIDLLEETLAELSTGKEVASAVVGPSAKRIFLEGGICNHPGIYKIIEEAGGKVVGDNLCTGFRYFNGLVDEENPDPIIAIADRYMERMICPAKHLGITDRAERLVEMVLEKRTQGVIFFFLKFCDPHAFDYPYLREALEKAGIPSLVVEVEDQLQAEGQLRTRLEAFIEMI